MMVLLFLVLFTVGQVNALTIGSKTLVSNAGLVVLPQIDTNNLLTGYIFLENGFNLQDNRTTCTFDGFMPVAGKVNLNGGQLHLQEDLVFSNTVKIQSGGRIYGNNRSVEFCNSIADQAIPEMNVAAPFLINTVASSAMLSQVNSVDWSFDSQYVGAVSNVSSIGSELRIYYFDGNTLTTTQSAELSRDVYSIRWHPSKHYVAVGRRSASGDEVYVYKLNISNGTLTQTAGRSLSSTAAVATSWHSSGDYLIVGTDGSSTAELLIYSFNQTTGALTDVGSLDLSPTRAIQVDALSFAPGGDRIVLGTAANATTGQTELLVCSFNGSALTITTSVDINYAVQGVDWNPTGTFVAVGLASGASQTLRIYEHSRSPEKLTWTTSANLGETLPVQGIHWDSTGTYLAVGFAGGLSSAVKTYYFDKTNKTLTLLNTAISIVAVYVVRWARNGQYLCFGDSLSNVVILRASNAGKYPFIFDNTAVVFNADTYITAPVHFIGNCKINGRGKRLTLGIDGSSLIVRPASQLILEDVELQGLGSSNVRCMTDNGSLVLRNCILTLDSDFTFSRGSILFEEDVLLSGGSKFIYSTRFGSTISSQSTLILDQDVTFSYAPIAARSNLLYQQDQTAVLYLNGCTLHSTRTGLVLDSGTLVFDDKVTLSSEAKNSGEAVRFGSNLNINVLGNTTLEFFGRIKSD